MFRFVRSFTVFVLLASCGAGLSFAQERLEPRKDRAINDRVEAEKLTLEVRHFVAAATQLAADASSVKPEGERALLTIKLSAVIWNQDELLARNLLLRSFDLITALYEEQEKTARTGSPTFDTNLLFQEVISVAGEHDRSLASNFERRRDASVKASQPSDFKGNDPVQLSDLLLKEAARVLKTDELRAHALVRQSAFNYVTQSHLYFLRELRKQSPELADRLFADVLRALSQRPLHEANEVLILASYLFSASGTVNYSLVGNYNAANVSGNLSGVPKNAALAQEYLSFVLRSLNISETIPATVVYAALNNMLPQFMTLAPELMNSAYARIGTARTQISDRDFEATETDRRADARRESFSWRERLERAEQTQNSDLRDLEYFTIIDGYLLPARDFSNAYKVLDRIDNNELREKLRDYTDLMFIEDTQNRAVRSRVDDEVTYNRISDPLIKALAICETANFLHQQNRNNEAVSLLEQALKQSERIAVGQDSLQVKAEVVNLYLDIDVPRALEIARDTFKGVGKVDDFNIEKSGFTFPVSVYGMRNQLAFGTSVGSSLVSSVKTMCQFDCVEALNVCDKIPQKSQRLWAKLVAINSFFSDRKHTAQATK